MALKTMAGSSFNNKTISTNIYSYNIINLEWLKVIIDESHKTCFHKLVWHKLTEKSAMFFLL